MFFQCRRDVRAYFTHWNAMCCQYVSHQWRGFLNCYYAPLNHFQNIKQSDLIISRGSHTNRPLTYTQPTQFDETCALTHKHWHLFVRGPLTCLYTQNALCTWISSLKKSQSKGWVPEVIGLIHSKYKQDLSVSLSVKTTILIWLKMYIFSYSSKPNAANIIILSET